MFKRDILTELEKWKASEFRKPLILRGARQVGKTTTIHEFGKTYANYLYYNLERESNVKIFEQERPIADMVNFLYLNSNQKKVGETLLFIDEIQNSPKTISKLRYLYEEIPQLHVIAAGSLLENTIDLKSSFPVGRVQYLSMHPCSFREFLYAMGADHLIDIMKEPNDTIAIHSQLQSLFNQFFVVGGMPEIVARYAKEHDVVALDDIFEALLQNYRDDVEKYAKQRKVTEVVRFILTHGWEKAGEIISLGNFGNSSYRAREVGEAFRLLQKAMLLELVYPTTSTVIPALPELSRMPKLIWFDTGIVNYAAQVRGEILGNNDILDLWRGHIAEQVVAQELSTLNYKIGQKRSFWTKGNGKNGAEVDFTWIVDGQLIPIEVKSGHNSRLKSLHSFIDQSTARVAVRVWSQPFSIDSIKTSLGAKEFTLINLPFYLVGDLENVLRNVVNN